MKLTREQQVQFECVQFVRVMCPKITLAASMNGLPLGDARKNPQIYGFISKMKALGLRPGEPDLLLRWPVSKTLWVELKANGEKPDQRQLDTIGQMNAEGHPAAWADSLEGFIRILEANKAPIRTGMYAGMVFR